MCIWRIARVWSLFDGIEVPDNMKSCISFMYGFEEFWRNWHRGFNIWLIWFIIFFNFRGNKVIKPNIQKFGMIKHITELEFLFDFHKEETIQ